MVAEEGLVGHTCDTTTSLLLRHLIIDRVVDTVGVVLFAAQFALKCHHSDFHILLAQLHLLEVFVQLSILLEGLVKLLLHAIDLALLLEHLVVQLIDL